MKRHAAAAALALYAALASAGTPQADELLYFGSVQSLATVENSSRIVPIPADAAGMALRGHQAPTASIDEDMQIDFTLDDGASLSFRLPASQVKAARLRAGGRALLRVTEKGIALEHTALTKSEATAHIARHAPHQAAILSMLAEAGHDQAKPAASQNSDLFAPGAMDESMRPDATSSPPHPRQGAGHALRPPRQ